MTRSTASGFEQGVACLAGLFTAGPLGALAAWGALRGLQGKWAPWVILGIPAAPILGFVQLVAMGALLAPFADYEAPVEEPTPIEQLYNHR